MQHPIRFLMMNATLSCRYAVNDFSLAKHLLFSDQMSDDEAREYWCKLQDESYRLFLDALFLNLPRQAPDPSVPRLLIEAGQDRIVTKPEIEASARFLSTKAKVIPQAAHDLMLDPTWKESAVEIETFIAELSV